MFIQVTADPIKPEAIIKTLEPEFHGAITTFMGTVRKFSEGHHVLHLDYEAYVEMAERQLQAIAEEVKKRDEIEDVSIAHRIGRLGIGETSLIVAVASVHRRPGFDACLYTVERIKELAPIWNKEVWVGGSGWVGALGA